MAKITITGDALVITSGMKLDTLRQIKKYRPEALTALDKEKVPVFCIDVGKVGSANKNGIVFTSATHDEDGFATFTEVIPSGLSAGEARTYAADKYGNILLKLNALEGTLNAVLDSITEEIQTVNESIEVA